MSAACFQVFLIASFAVAHAFDFQDGDQISLKFVTSNKFCSLTGGVWGCTKSFDLSQPGFDLMLAHQTLLTVGDGVAGKKTLYNAMTMQWCGNVYEMEAMTMQWWNTFKCTNINTAPGAQLTFEQVGSNIAITQADTGGKYLTPAGIGAYGPSFTANTAASAQFEVCKWNNAKTICTVMQAAVAVGGDPILTIDGVEKKFTMPLHKLTLLLRTEELSVQVSVFPGEAADEQWIDRVLVTSLDGEVVADINIRKDLNDFDREKEPVNALETLTARAPWLSEPALSLPRDSDALVPIEGLKCCKAFPRQFDHHSNVSFILMRVLAANKSSEQKDQLAPRSEGLLFSSKSVGFMVSSVSAFEYYWADQKDTRALKYAHLDINFFSMSRSHTFKGLLPELWGPDASHTECAVGGKQASKMNFGPFTRPGLPIEPELQRMILDTPF